MTDFPYTAIVISDELRLVQLQPEQASRLYELTDDNREYLANFLPWVPFVTKVEDSEKHIRETLENRANNTAYTYGIEYDGKIIGDISLRNIDDSNKTEIGYWIDQDYSGKGITTRAVEALTKFAMKLGLKKILIRAVPDNIASNKVAQKAGYEFVGEVKDEEYKVLNVWAYKRQ